ncbi:hypothetical protein F4677DRAFT_298286 [Hypoxylon crocopeplum]|nr:hypothetical protein F4677DRAFT_298286 [Hypoxylon crocopeplum]
MPPKKSSGSSENNGGDVTLSAGDSKLIDTILKNCSPDSKPTQANWENITTRMGFKGVGVTKTRFGQVCKKYQWFGATEGDPADPSTPVTPSTTKRRAAASATPKAKRNISPHCGEEADAKGTPTKKRKASYNAMKAVQVAQAEFDAAEDIDSQDGTSDGGEDPAHLVLDEI